MKPSQLNKFMLCGLSILVISACNGKSPLEALEDPQSNIAESSTAAVGSVATDSEGGSISAASFHPQSQASDVANEVANDVVSKVARGVATGVSAMSVCSYTSARGACNGNAMTVQWNGCEMTTDSGVNLMLTNGWTNTYDSSATCTTAQGGGALTTNGQSMTRTSSSFIITLLAGATLTTDTNAHTTANLNQVIPGTGVTTTVGTSSKTITINGARQILHGPQGSVWFDHSLTSTAMNVTGTRAAANRVITGQVTIYHNTEAFKAVSTFNNVTWGNAACCFPTAGTLTTTYSGSVTGNSTMTYSSTCGTGTFTNTSGQSSQVSLSICE